METFLIVVVCIILFWRVFVRWILPYMMGRLAKKLQQNMTDQFQNQRQYTERQKYNEGDVFVDDASSRKNNKSNSDEVGDYVDYEEID